MFVPKREKSEKAFIVFEFIGKRGGLSLSMRFHDCFDALSITCIDDDVKNLVRINRRDNNVRMIFFQ